MPLPGASIDEPQTLRHLMALAQPKQSHIGRTMDAGRAHAHLSGGSGGSGGGPAPKSHSVAKKERDRLLQLQRAHQEAWAVAATRELALPALRTMAPSFTKTSDEGQTVLGGTKIGGAGYNTLIGMVPTADSVRCIADEDELISSFRPYRIDALRAARAAAATTESAPHPDDARILEPTLQGISASRLIDGRAIPEDVVREHWNTASVFTAASELPKETELLSLTESNLQPGNAQTLHCVPRGTSSFCAPQRFKEERSLPGVRKPSLGHYHLCYSQVDPRVVGGYISKRETSAVSPRGSPDKKENDVVGADGTTTSPQRATQTLAGTVPTADMTRDLGSTFWKTVQEHSPVSQFVEKIPGPPLCRGSSMFISKTGRSSTTAGCQTKDLDYWPFADVRSTTKRPKCGVKFDTKFTERRHDGVVPSPAVGQYNVAGDFSRDLSRVVCMDRSTGRAGDWRNRTAAYQDAPDTVDIDKSLALTRPRMRCVSMAPNVAESDDAEKPPADISVSIERDPHYPRTTFDPRAVRKVRHFACMVGRDDRKPPPAPEPIWDTERQLVTPRVRALTIHAKAPGHAPLHAPNPTEVGDVPSLRLVRPNGGRTIRFGVGAERPFAGAHMHDLRYDTARRMLVDPRTTGNPMMESQVSRDKRAKIFSKSGCGAVAVYNTDVPTKAKSVPLFEKQITKETQFCGHRMQSERWERNNPKAPGPGHYNVSFHLVE